LSTEEALKMVDDLAEAGLLILAFLGGELAAKTNMFGTGFFKS